MTSRNSPPFKTRASTKRAGSSEWARGEGGRGRLVGGGNDLANGILLLYIRIRVLVGIAFDWVSEIVLF